EAQERAAQFLYLHESPETLVAELLKIAETGGRDYIIIDDAAIGFFDLGPKVWSALMDAVKVARESLVKGWLIFTTTNTHFISRRVTASAKLVHLVRRREVSLAPHRSGCLYILDDYTRGALYTDEAVEAVELIHSVRYVSSPQWHVAHPAMMSRTLTAVPRAPDLAMPTAVEKAHLEARRRRVAARLQEVLEFLHSRREEEGEEGGAGG
ncbi:hypothetical protein, partial [Pyrobaculum sp.]|uniref:hypothetical protein n=1 Tax=Pyrobaculum sp. TaxID=2004705 RepID=UPI003D0CE8B0